MNRPPKIKPCGTNAAFHRHRYKGQLPCSDCLRAHAEYEKQRYQLRRAAA